MTDTLTGTPALDAVNAALATVQDPEINRPLTELGMVKDVQIGADGAVRVEVYLTVAGCPMRETITNRVTTAVSAVPGVTSVQVVLDVMSDEQRAELRKTVRGTDAADPVIPFAQPGSLTRVYAVASGKGGVGKSSVTVNLAASLARRGLSVGVVDADIYGHSVPRMLGVEDKPTQVDNMIMPPQAYGVKVISIGMFTPGNTPVVWRGPMLHRALQQFLADVWWGDLDVLLMDLPPGTGDVAISVAQLVPNAEILVVTTPQLAAAEVAERAGAIATQTHQQVVGVVENMSWLELPDGSRMEVFGSGGGEAVSDALTKTLGARVPLLGQIPLDTRLREAGDAGAPIVLAEPDSPAAQALEKIADGLATRQRGLSGHVAGPHAGPPLSPLPGCSSRYRVLQDSRARERPRSASGAAAYGRAMSDRSPTASPSTRRPRSSSRSSPTRASTRRIDGSGSVRLGDLRARADHRARARRFTVRMKLFGVPYADPQPGRGVRAGPADRLAALHRQPLALRARAHRRRRDDGHRDLRPARAPTGSPTPSSRWAKFPERNREGIAGTLARLKEAAEADASEPDAAFRVLFAVPEFCRTPAARGTPGARRDHVASGSNGGGVAWSRGRAMPRRSPPSRRRRVPSARRRRTAGCG